MKKKDVAILPAKWSLDTSALLAPKGMDPTKDVPKKSSGENPFSIWSAVKVGNLVRVRELLEVRGESVETRDLEHGRTPLHWACRCDKIDIIEYLFSKDADINATDNDGNTPLHYVAAFTNTPSMILTLLDMDVIYDALNHANETPADMARRCGKALHARMLDLYKPVPEPLVMADEPEPDTLDVALSQAATLRGNPIMSEVLAGSVEMGHIYHSGVSMASSTLDASLGNSMLSGDQNDPAVELATTLRALAIKTKTVGHMHRSLVPSLTKLIRLFTDAGDVVNAKMCHEQRLAIMEAESAKETQDLDMLGLTSGDSHISGPWLKDLSSALFEYGEYLYHHEDVADAQAVLMHAVEVMDRIHGEDNIKVVPASMALARAQFKLAMHVSAQLQLQRCVRCLIEHSGDNHPSIAPALSLLGKSLQRTEDFAGAAEQFKHALACTTPPTCTAPCPITLDTAECYEDLAKSLQECSPLSPLIEASLRKALDIRSKLQGESHDEVMISRKALGDAVVDRRHKAKLAAAGLSVVSGPPSSAASSGLGDVDPSPSLVSNSRQSLRSSASKASKRSEGLTSQASASDFVKPGGGKRTTAIYSNPAPRRPTGPR